MQTSLILPCGGSDSKGMGKAEGCVELKGRVPGLEKPGEWPSPKFSTTSLPAWLEMTLTAGRKFSTTKIFSGNNFETKLRR